MNTKRNGHFAYALTAVCLGLGLTLAVMTLLLAGTQPARAADLTFRVDRDAPGPAHDGTSWATAYLTLQAGLDAATYADEIWVAEGVYTPTNGVTRTATFQMKPGVAIYGGFAGYGVSETQRTQRNWTAHVTILSGDLDGNDTNADGNSIAETPGDIQGINAYHVVTATTGITQNAVLDGFTVTAGQANGTNPHDFGGGMFNNGGSPTLENLTFSGNQANTAGGGMYNENSSPTLTNVIFRGNQVTSSSNGGGGMTNSTSPAVLTNVAFYGNQAYYGGGVYNWNSNPTFTNVTLAGNQASNTGGAIYNSTANPTLVNCIVWGNTPTPQVSGGSPTVSYSDVEGGCPGGATCSNLININPLFVSAIAASSAPTSTGNYHLLSNSPAIDAGNSLSVTASTDLDGNPRIVGGAVDLGAYEAPPRCFATLNTTLVYSSANASAVQQAVDAASANSVVKIAGNCFGVQARAATTQTVHVSQTLTLAGGYTVTDWTVAYPLTQPTTLDAQNGGRVISASADLSLSDLTIQNGNDSGHGGGIYAGGALTLTNVNVLSSTATSNTYNGGGVYVTGAATLSGGRFENNSAANYGGGLQTNSTLALTGTQFISNTAVYGGGGLSCWTSEGNSRVVNALFARNSTGSFGAALYLQNGVTATFLILHTTIVSPTTGANAAIYISQLILPVFTVNITNTIVASYTTGIVKSSSATVNSDYNLFYNAPTSVATGSHSIVGTNPAFVNPAGDDYHLTANSPVIDRGTDAGVTSDLDGTARPRGAGFDIGAYESPYLLLRVGKLGTGSGVVTSTPAGVDCGITCTYGFSPNTAVTLTVSPLITSTFTGWSGACSGVGTCAVTMTETKIVTATFTAITNVLTVTLTGTGSGVITSTPPGINCAAGVCAHDFVTGTAITLTAAPLITSTFTGWSGACSSAGACAVTMTETKAATATFAIINRPPVAADDVAFTPEDTPRAIAVLDNDSDPDENPLAIASIGAPAHGAALLNGAAILYTPTLNFNGTDPFTYTVSDGALSSAARVTVTVTPVNDPPIGHDDTAATNEDTPVTIRVLDNDSDIEGNLLTVGGLGVPARGTLTTDGDTVTYSPALNVSGTDSFTYTVSDSGGASGTAWVTVTVAPVNDAPQAVSDAITTTEDTPISVLVLVNDTDVEGDPLTIVSVDALSHGVAAIVGTGIVYTPALNYFGADSLRYTVSDGNGVGYNGGYGTAMVYLTVTPVNDPPQALDDATMTEVSTPVQVDALANDSDVDGDSLTLLSVGAPAHGAAAINAASVMYTPASGFTGLDTFLYTIDDGHGGTASATINVVVGAQSETVLAVNDDAVTDEDTSVTVAVLANDVITSGTLTLLGVGRAGHGAATLSGASVIYTPAANYSGWDALTYIVTDGGSGASRAGVSIFVNPVNDAPDAVDDSATLDEDTSVTIPLLDNDTDVDGDPVSILQLNPPEHGRVVLITSGESVQARYTPDQDYNGADRFSYVVSDGQLTDTAEVRLTLIPVNDAPNAVDDLAATDEDTSLDINVLLNDSDIDVGYNGGDTLSVIRLSPAQHGTVITQTDGRLRYSPDKDYNGADEFAYTVGDGHGGASSAMVRVTVRPVDDPPQGVPDGVILSWSPGSSLRVERARYGVAATAAETPTAEINLLGNDVNVDGAQLAVTRVGRARKGRVEFSADGKLKYMPDAGFGTDTFTYTVGAVGMISESIQAINIILNPAGEVTATNDTVATDEDKPVTFNVLSNDTALTGTLSVMGVIPGKGRVLVNSNNTLTYMPLQDINGTDVLTYIVGNGLSGGSLATVTVIITPVNDPPRAAADMLSTWQGISATLNVLANDTDVDIGDTLRVVELIQPRNGKAAFNATGVVTYTPNSGFRGADSFTYVVRDSHGADALGVVSVDVVSLNQPPTAAADLASTPEDTPVVVRALLNDFDPDESALTLVQTTQGRHGSVAYGGDVLTYTPALNFNGTDTFTYTVSDGDLNSQAAVKVTVTPVNDAPNAADDTANTPDNTPRLIYVLGNDSDVDGDALTLLAFGQPSQGVVAAQNGGLLYTPSSGFSGGDIFTYTIADGTLANTARVTITVGTSNTAPDAADDAAVTAEDTPVTIAVLNGDTDPDGDSLGVIAVGAAAHGWTSLDGQKVIYRPAQNFVGADTFTYTVSDGVLMVVGQVTLTITPVNDPPTAVADHVYTMRNTPVVIDVLANDTDIDGDRVNVSAVITATQQGGAASLFISPAPGEPRKVVYTPTMGFWGNDVLTYTLTDGALTSTGRVTVTVNTAALNLTKTVSTASGLPWAMPGEVVTYTLVLAYRSGDTAATGIVLSDLLPAGVQFGDWIEGQQGTVVFAPPGNVITWALYLGQTQQRRIRFTAVVTTSRAFSGTTLVNTARHTSVNAAPGESAASFTIGAQPPPPPSYRIYLPQIMSGAN